MNTAVRRRLTCRWPVTFGCPPQRSYLGGRRDPFQRFHLCEHSFQMVKAAPIALDALGNPISFLVALAPGGSVTSRFDVTVRSDVSASAFDRPWEHASVHRGGRSRRVDPLALELSDEPDSLPSDCFEPFRPLYSCIRALNEAHGHDVDRVVRALRSRGIGARVSVGIALSDDPRIVLRGDVYTPDWGWHAIDPAPMLSIAAVPSTRALAGTAGVHLTDDISYESF